MDASDIFLIAWAFLLFLAFGAAGARYEGAWIWRWADAFYYPLAAIGVVLLFFASEADRRLLDLETKKAALAAEWSRHPNIRPQATFDASSSELLSARYGWFSVVREHGDICKTSTSEDCHFHLIQGELVREVFGDFTPWPDRDEPAERAKKEEEYCRLGQQLLRREADISRSISNPVELGLHRVRKGEPETSVQADLARAIAAERDRYLRLVDPSARGQAGRHAALRGEFALTLFGRLAWCELRSPNDAASLRALDRWQGEAARRKRLRSEVDREIENAKGDGERSSGQRFAHAVQQRWWPFILVLALAIKFGKATSGLTEERCQWRRRLRVSARILARRMKRGLSGRHPSKEE